jgi:hypothetical protein
MNNFLKIKKTVFINIKNCRIFLLYIINTNKDIKMDKTTLPVIKNQDKIKNALIELYQVYSQIINEKDDSKLKIEIKNQILQLRDKYQQHAGSAALNIFDNEYRDVILLINSTPTLSTLSKTSFIGRMTNEQLAHEILINPFFQLNDNENDDDNYDTSIYKRMNHSLEQTFWDNLTDNLKLDNPCYIKVLDVLLLIHDGIKEFEDEDSLISKVIDINFIKYQLEQKSYYLNDCINLIKSIMTIIFKLMVLERKEKTKILWDEIEITLQNCVIDTQPQIICKSLKFFITIIRLIRIDVANDRLRLIAPIIKNNGVEYERMKFKMKLDNGTLTLDKTRTWFYNSIEKEIDTISDNKSYLDNIYLKSMFSLVFNEILITNDNCPETLLLDGYRLSKLQLKFKYLILCSTILTIITHHLITINQINNDIFKKISNIITLQSSIEDIINELKISTLSEESKNILISTISGIIQTDVYKIIHNRMYSYCFQIIETNSMCSDCFQIVKNNSICSVCSQFVNIIQCLIPQINKVLTELIKLSKINYNIHYSTYNTILQDKIAAICSSATE